MTEVNKREELKKAYNSAGWVEKVERMSEAQVTAIYLKLKSQGKL